MEFHSSASRLTFGAKTSITNDSTECYRISQNYLSEDVLVRQFDPDGRASQLAMIKPRKVASATVKALTGSFFRL